MSEAHYVQKRSGRGAVQLNMTNNKYAHFPFERRDINILPHIMNRQIIGQPLSRLKCYRRAAANHLSHTVKPRKLQNIVNSFSQLHKRVFLGFLKGTFWLISYKYLPEGDDRFGEGLSDTDENTDGLDEMSTHRVGSDCVLEFWLYHPNKQIELKHIRSLFTDRDMSWIRYPHELLFTVYQWITKPEHILVFGQKIASFENDNEDSILTITYLAVPVPLPSNSCPMCLKSKSLSTFCCVKHDCLLDFLGSVECYSKTLAEKHLKIPNTMYLSVSGQSLYCVSMSHTAIGEDWAIPHSVDESNVSNILTTVYSGHTTDNSTDVQDGCDGYLDISMNCTTTKGSYYLPVTTIDEFTQLKNEQDICFIVRRSWLDLQLLIIEKVYPILVEKTSWFNTNCIQKDWTAEYIEICAESGAAVCEITFKLGEDPRFFDPLDQHVCSATFIWNPSNGDVQITKFDEGILVYGGDDMSGGESVLVKRAKNPYWLSKLSKKYKQPPTEKSVIELNNTPYIRGESLNMLRSMDRTAIITL